MGLGVRVEVNTGGIKDVLSDAQQRSATLKAVRAGVKIVNAAAKAAAPRLSGALKASQGVKAVKGKKGQTGSFAVQGAKTKYKKMWRGKKLVPAFYDHLVIGGTKSHGVKKGGGSVKKKHPGARPNAYRERAYRSVSGEVTEAMRAVLGVEVQKSIDKAAAKLRGG